MRLKYVLELVSELLFEFENCLTQAYVHLLERQDTKYFVFDMKVSILYNLLDINDLNII